MKREEKERNMEEKRDYVRVLKRKGKKMEREKTGERDRKFEIGG